MHAVECRDWCDATDLAAAWLADQQNLPTINQIQAADKASGPLPLTRAKSRTGGVAGAGQSWTRPQTPADTDLVLLDCLYPEEGSLLYRIATVLSRIEDLSHILVHDSWGLPLMSCIARCGHLRPKAQTASR